MVRSREHEKKYLVHPSVKNIEIIARKDPEY